jgi:hypothetical protein
VGASGLLTKRYTTTTTFGYGKLLSKIKGEDNMKYAFCNTAVKEPEKNAVWAVFATEKEAVQQLKGNITHTEATKDNYEAFYGENGHVLVGDHNGTFE